MWDNEKYEKHVKDIKKLLNFAKDMEELLNEILKHDSYVRQVFEKTKQYKIREINDIRAKVIDLINDINKF